MVEPTGASTSGAADARRTKVADVNAVNVCNAVDGVLDAQLYLSKGVAAVASKQGSLSYAGNPGANSPALQQLCFLHLPAHSACSQGLMRDARSIDSVVSGPMPADTDLQAKGTGSPT